MFRTHIYAPLWNRAKRKHPCCPVLHFLWVVICLVGFSIIASCAHAQSGLYGFWHQAVCLVPLCSWLCHPVRWLAGRPWLLNVAPRVLWPARSAPDWLYGWWSSLNKGMPQTAKNGCRIQEHQMQNSFQIFIASKQSIGWKSSAG